MKVTVNCSTGSVWEEVEVEVNEVNPRIALVMACHEAMFPMAERVGVKPATMVDRMMRKLGDALAGLRAMAKKEEDDDATGE